MGHLKILIWKFSSIISDLIIKYFNKRFFDVKKWEFEQINLVLNLSLTIVMSHLYFDPSEITKVKVCDVNLSTGKAYFINISTSTECWSGKNKDKQQFMVLSGAGKNLGKCMHAEVLLV